MKRIIEFQFLPCTNLSLGCDTNQCASCFIFWRWQNLKMVLEGVVRFIFIFFKEVWWGWDRKHNGSGHPVKLWAISHDISFPECSCHGVGGITKATCKCLPIPCLSTMEDCTPNLVLGPCKTVLQFWLLESMETAFHFVFGKKAL